MPKRRHAVPTIYGGPGGLESGALSYEVHGEGAPVALLHGLPPGGPDRGHQVVRLLRAGYWVITYDRGDARAGLPAAADGDYDAFAADLRALATLLDLREVALVGSAVGDVDGDVPSASARRGGTPRGWRPS